MVVLWAAPAPLHAQTPNGPETTVEYDAQSGSYIKVTRLGDMVISREYMTFEEYQSYQMDQLMKDLRGVPELPDGPAHEEVLEREIRCG